MHFLMTNASIKLHLDYLNQKELSVFLEKKDFDPVNGNANNAKRKFNMGCESLLLSSSLLSFSFLSDRMVAQMVRSIGNNNSRLMQC